MKKGLYKLYKYNSQEQMLTVHGKIMFQLLTIVSNWFKFKTIDADINDILQKYMPNYTVIYDSHNLLLKSLLVKIIMDKKMTFNDIFKTIKDNNYVKSSSNTHYLLHKTKIYNTLYKFVAKLTIDNISKTITICIIHFNCRLNLQSALPF